MRLALIAILLLLPGCRAITNWAYGVGEHMPVIGERCEHWQCVTASGQQKSDEQKMMPPAESPPPEERKAFPTSDR
jgi:hypothetical protein